MADTVNPISYQQLVNTSDGSGSNSSGSANFSDMVKSAFQSLKGTMNAGEKVSEQALLNQADLNDLVTKVAEAEVALQLLQSIRDKAVAAYQDIMKMPM